MTAQEIKQMADEDVIGFHRQLPPFLSTRMDWRCFPILKQRQGMPPPELSALPDLAEPLFRTEITEQRSAERLH